ncbi:hypothetical protein ACHWQZ_G008425 [Mnemiopsis leidyi]
MLRCVLLYLSFLLLLASTTRSMSLTSGFICDLMSRGITSSVLFVLLPVLSLAQSDRYIVLRVDNITALSQTSALFERTEPINNTEIWNCKSGPNPVKFTNADSITRTRAKSIDLEQRVELECLGIRVLVREKKRVSVWYGDESPCPGFMQTTDNLVQEGENANITISFKFIPNLLFDVYNKAPTEDCAKQETVLIRTPRVNFVLENGTVSGCRVESPTAALLVCNMSIITGEGDVVSMATGATFISIPKFVQTMSTSRIDCTCECRISSNTTYSTTRKDTLPFTPRTHDNTSVTTAPAELLTNKGNSHIILILVYVLAFLFFVSTVMTIVFLHVSRRLHKRLHRVLGEQRKVLSGACSHPASQCRMSQRVTGSATAPPRCFDGHYSTLHRIRNECHHYNTVSLRLSDCIELRKDADDKPVYQKLNYNDKFNDIEDFSMATSV